MLPLCANYTELDQCADFSYAPTWIIQLPNPSSPIPPTHLRFPYCSLVQFNLPVCEVGHLLEGIDGNEDRSNISLSQAGQGPENSHLCSPWLKCMQGPWRWKCTNTSPLKTGGPLPKEEFRWGEGLLQKMQPYPKQTNKPHTLQLCTRTG